MKTFICLVYKTHKVFYFKLHSILSRNLLFFKVVFYIFLLTFWLYWTVIAQKELSLEYTI